MKKVKAFSLIELLTAMAVLIILISIASQSYNHLFAQQALVASGERLQQFLRLAKSQSVKKNTKVYVHFCKSLVSDQWKMGMSELGACDCFTKNSCLMNGTEKVVELADGKYVFTSTSNITFSGSQASYTPMRFSVNAGSIVLNDSSGSKLKVIQSAMRLRICTPDGDKMGYKQC